LQQALKYETRDFRRRELVQRINQQHQGSLSRLEEVIVEELCGNASQALADYQELVEQPQFDLPTRVTFTPAEVLRITVDALVIQRDLPRATAGLEKLKSHVSFPEDLYVECLSYHIADVRSG